MPANFGDVELRWRPLTAPEQEVTHVLLTDAWLILKARVPGITGRVSSGDLEPELVTAVLCSMVLRVLRNPGGFRSETIDDWTGVRDAAISSGALYVSETELDDLAPVPYQAGAFTIKPRTVSTGLPTMAPPSGLPYGGSWYTR